MMDLIRNELSVALWWLWVRITPDGPGKAMIVDAVCALRGGEAMTRISGVFFMCAGMASHDPSHIASFCMGAFLIGCCKVAEAIREAKA
jgi:hypothetical protein